MYAMDDSTVHLQMFQYRCRPRCAYCSILISISKQILLNYKVQRKAERCHTWEGKPRAERLQSLASSDPPTHFKLHYIQNIDSRYDNVVQAPSSKWNSHESLSLQSQTSALIQSKTKIQSKTPLATVLSTHPVQIQMHIHHDTSAILLVILCVSKTTDNDLSVCTEFSVNM